MPLSQSLYDPIPVKTERVTAANVWGGRSLINVVEDSDFVLASFSKILQERGFSTGKRMGWEVVKDYLHALLEGPLQ